MENLRKAEYLQWAKQINVRMDLILGDDADSLLSCNLLESITGGKWSVNWFYNFENFYRHDKTGNKQVGVDMAFTKKIRCFDNHVSLDDPLSEHNPFCVNLNLYNGITRSNYTEKYAMSTLLMIMSYYNVPLPKTKLGKQILLAVDVAFKGHYSSQFKEVHNNWLEYLGYSELIDILNESGMDELYGILKQFNLNGKVRINDDGLIETDIDLEGIQPYLDWELKVPDKQFKLVMECVSDANSTYKKLPEYSQLISLAYTRKNFVSYTYQQAQ